MRKHKSPIDAADKHRPRYQVEAFVANGRGAITIPTSTPLGGSAGVYLLGGALGSALTAGGEGAAAAVVNNATAWGMCM